MTTTHQVLGSVPLRKPDGSPHPQTDDQRRRSKHAQKTRHNRRGNNFRARVRMAHDKGWPQGHKRHTQRVAMRPAQRVAPPQTGHTIGGGVEGGRGFFGVSTSLPHPPLPKPDQTILAEHGRTGQHAPTEAFVKGCVGSLDSQLARTPSARHMTADWRSCGVPTHDQSAANMALTCR